ncbi:Phenylalanine--tRNA ligase alpha subunit [Candidatus Arsenophonus lipoptenae]|uniref:Phenylalanine--tRNA ligase alpha subunit n=1 Tax=Candidatus Arsenophonus lipoptenae TaxID=634113 RepID=A0A0X9WAC9_9GAMM|nr:phenylalanine--tRNA ligase subunit alpha [Candidatus Arsenophonus lipoptenae]AMA64838.1 Phenylalanine--tRNA ligase alpha subunit [Candidatus Arsenophonus lipoptenae]
MLHLVKLVAQAKTAIAKAQDVATLNSIKVEFLGKKGHIKIYMLKLHNFTVEKRPIMGKAINQAKKNIQNLLNIRQEQLKNIILSDKLQKETIDISLPGRQTEVGNLHPITRTIDRIEKFFRALGFSIVYGPEIEDNYHNFDALNIPDYHPSRNIHDTFWFDTNRLLRTQTSSVQIRSMKGKQPPIRIIAPGRVYRNDFDKTHTPMFHQTEGLIVDQHVKFTNLKSILYDFLNYFFETKICIRFRPSYFPFTKLSAEIDVMHKNDKWLEILGCGMIHPNVLNNVGINPNLYSGFAFGIGMERLTMLRYEVTDLRAFFQNDLRFLKQFR